MNRKCASFHHWKKPKEMLFVCLSKILRLRCSKDTPTGAIERDTEKSYMKRAVPFFFVLLLLLLPFIMFLFCFWKLGSCYSNEMILRRDIDVEITCNHSWLRRMVEHREKSLDKMPRWALWLSRVETFENVPWHKIQWQIPKRNAILSKRTV